MHVWSPLPSELWSGGGKTETAQPQPRYATNSIIASSFPWLREELPGPSRPAGDPAAAALSTPSSHVRWGPDLTKDLSLPHSSHNTGSLHTGSPGGR